jgi:hypothetical protein
MLTVGASMLLAVVLGACTSSHPTSSPSNLPGTTTTTVSVPPYNPAKNARQDVTVGACIDRGTKGWSLSGTVRNSAATPRGYSIAVDFVTVPGDTVVDTKLVTVARVQPQASARWLATGAAPGVKNLTCVVRQTLAT